jgi:hypothetical protein
VSIGYRCATVLVRSQAPAWPVGCLRQRYAASQAGRQSRAERVVRGKDGGDGPPGRTCLELRAFLAAWSPVHCRNARCPLLIVRLGAVSPVPAADGPTQEDMVLR